MTEVAENPPTKEAMIPVFDAVIACGMGPMALKNSRDPERNPVPMNVFNFFNAVAANITVSKGWARQGILSGFQSNPVAPSEGRVLGHIFGQTRPKGIAREDVIAARNLKVIEEAARTTFGNIFEGLNLLDAVAPGGHFDGPFGVISCEFHGPRIAEMLKAFGLTAGRFVSAEGVLRAVGYTGGARSWGDQYKAYNEGAYPGQPAALQNLTDNPSYVTRDLAVITSPRRFWEVASALMAYYREQNIPVPDCYTKLPEAFDLAFDYEGQKAAFAAVPFTKHPFIGESERAVAVYRGNVLQLTNETMQVLGKP